MMLSKPAWRAIALIVALAFFALALRVDVYNATSPRSLERVLFGHNVMPFAHPWYGSLHVWLRKAYSIAAFMLVGFTANRALSATSRPALRAAAIVAAYSLAIELAQRLFVAPEPVSESILDVACGALGGWLAIFAGGSLSSRAQRAAIFASLRRRRLG